MGRLPRLFGVGSSWMLEILPSVAALVIGGYLLAQFHFGRATEPATAPTPSAQAAATSEEPTVSEDRAAMRQVLKERREKPEQPAQVRPIAMPVTASTAAAASVPPPPVKAPAVTAAIPMGMDSISPREPMARPAIAPSRPAVVTAPPGPPRPDAEEGEVYVPAPPPGLPPAPARGMDAPTVIVPSMATATEPPAASPNAPQAAPTEPHGPVGVVFSTVSSFVGHAANATGNTVDWVIDLPGKAISAGGRVIGVTPPPPPPSPRPFS
ncbi:MAG TPA: hypothetical protein VII40_10330 [Xanthobacteraceae bacterium]